MTNGAAALFMRTAYQTAAIYFGDTPLDVPLVGVVTLADQRVSDHAGGKGLPGLRVDQQECPGSTVPGVRLGRDRLGGADPQTPDVVEPQVVGRHDPDGGEVQDPVDCTDDRPRGAGRVLEQHPAALAQGNVREPADGGDQVARRLGCGGGGTDEISASHVDVVGEAQRDRARGEGFGKLTDD